MLDGDGGRESISWLGYESGENYSVPIRILLKYYFQGKVMKKDLFGNMNC